MEWYTKMAQQWARIFGVEKSENKSDSENADIDFEEMSEAELLEKLEKTESLSEKTSGLQGSIKKLTDENSKLVSELKAEKEKNVELSKKLDESSESETKLKDEVSTYETKFVETNKKFDEIAKELNEIKTLGIKKSGEGKDFDNGKKDQKDVIKMDWGVANRSRTRSYFN